MFPRQKEKNKKKKNISFVPVFPKSSGKHSAEHKMQHFFGYYKIKINKTPKRMY